MNKIVESPIEGEQVAGAVSAEAGESAAIGTTATGWRNVFKIHPACAIFPASSPDDLRVLGEDIKANGLRETIKYVRYMGTVTRV
jgi:hypothetical protein